MPPNEVLLLIRDFLWTGLLMVAPAVVTSLIVGLAISLLQTMTSIQEQTLSFAPRIVAVCIVLGLTLTWTLNLASGFAHRWILHMAELSR